MRSHDAALFSGPGRARFCSLRRTKLAKWQAQLTKVLWVGADVLGMIVNPQFELAVVRAALRRNFGCLDSPVGLASAIMRQVVAELSPTALIASALMRWNRAVAMTANPVERYLFSAASVNVPQADLTVDERLALILVGGARHWFSCSVAWRMQFLFSRGYFEGVCTQYCRDDRETLATWLGFRSVPPDVTSDVYLMFWNFPMEVREL